MVRKSNKKGKVDDIRVLDGDSNIPDPSTVSSFGEATGEVQRLVDIGLDISTSCTGICVLDSKTGQLVKLTHKKLVKFEDEYEKADNFLSDWIDPSWKVRRIYIEEAAKKFTPGFSSAGSSSAG